MGAIKSKVDNLGEVNQKGLPVERVSKQIRWIFSYLRHTKMLLRSKVNHSS